MVAFVIQVITPSGSSTEQVKVASSPGQTHRVSGVSDPITAPTACGIIIVFTHLIDIIVYPLLVAIAIATKTLLLII